MTTIQFTFNNTTDFEHDTFNFIYNMLSNYPNNIKQMFQDDSKMVLTNDSIYISTELGRDEAIELLQNEEYFSNFIGEYIKDELFDIDVKAGELDYDHPYTLISDFISNIT